MLRAGVVVAVLIATQTVAHAEAWYFEWRCAGACAPNTLDVRGVEGPYGSESSCDGARSAKLAWVLGPGSAGTASPCSDGTASGPPGSSGGPVQAAHLSRMFLGVIGGGGYQATYADGTQARSSRQVGGELEAAFGRDVFGLSVVLGVAHDPGTPNATMPAEPLWLFELGVGLVSSPFAAIRTRALEIRPELGAYVFNVERVSCSRCDPDPLGLVPSEASNAIGGRLRAGIDVYFGARHAQGISIDALLAFYKIGDFTDETAPTSVELVPPRFLLRVSWIPVRD